MTGRRPARSVAVCVDGAPIDWGVYIVSAGTVQEAMTKAIKTVWKNTRPDTLEGTVRIYEHGGGPVMPRGRGGKALLEQDIGAETRFSRPDSLECSMWENGTDIRAMWLDKRQDAPICNGCMKGLQRQAGGHAA